jgi:hypothetical protein
VNSSGDVIMKTAIVFFAGALFTSAAFGAASDSSAEQRYRIKYGRNTPAEEARQKAGNRDTMTGCCHSMEGPALTGGTAAEERFRMKTGRHTSAEEARLSAVMELAAAHLRKCVQLGHCPLPQAHSAAIPAPGAAPAGLEERFRMKYGRHTPAEEARQASRDRVAADRPLMASAAPACDHECCNHAR